MEKHPDYTLFCYKHTHGSLEQTELEKRYHLSRLLQQFVFFTIYSIMFVKHHDIIIQLKKKKNESMALNCKTKIIRQSEFLYYSHSDCIQIENCIYKSLDL